MTKVDIVIPIHNALDFFKKCLQTILENTDKDLINSFIFVDDFSGQETKNFIKEFVEKEKNNYSFKIFQTDKQKWFTRASNIGLRASIADRVILINTDTEVGIGWLEELQNVMDETDALLVGSLYHPESPTRYAEQIEPNYVTGHCWLLKKEAFTIVGYLDEVHPDAIHINSDRYYSYSVNRAGHKPVYSYHSIVHHHGSRSWNAGNVWQVLSMRNEDVD